MLQLLAFVRDSGKRCVADTVGCEHGHGTALHRLHGLDESRRACIDELPEGSNALCESLALAAE